MRGTVYVVWSSLRSYWLRSGVLRRCLLAGAALVALVPVCSMTGALVLSRALRSSAAGWGDLIGAVLGIYAGFWIGASTVFALAARLGSRSWWVGVVGAAGLLPVTVFTVALATNLGAPLPVTTVALLVLVIVGAVWVGSPRRSRETG